MKGWDGTDGSSLSPLATSRHAEKEHRAPTTIVRHSPIPAVKPSIDLLVTPGAPPPEAWGTTLLPPVAADAKEDPGSPFRGARRFVSGQAELGS